MALHLSDLSASLRRARGPVLLAVFALVSAVSRSTSAHADTQGSFEAKFAQWKPAFAAAWNSDSACAQHESLNSYIDWIHSFYFDSSGWFDQSNLIVSKIVDPAVAAAITADLERLGKRIAPEWAKPNDCRKVRTFGADQSLQAYAQILNTAEGSDSAEGTKLTAAIAEIQQKLDAANVPK